VRRLTVGNTGNARTTPPHLHYGIYGTGAVIRCRHDLKPAPTRRCCPLTGCSPRSASAGSVTAEIAMRRSAAPRAPACPCWRPVPAWARRLLGRGITFSAPQLGALDRKFPRDYKKLGGLISISLLNPRLSLPGGGRLKLDFDIGIGGMGNASRNPSGHFALESGLRFDPGTRGLHWTIRKSCVTCPALGGAMNDSARTLLNGWLLDYAREEPVYRLDDNMIGRMASRRIERVDIDPGLITIRLD
jgi:hypothetical protein